MYIAHTTEGEPIPARPGADGVCPDCHATVIPKCGEILIWHWAHAPGAGSECVGALDPWREGESGWHLMWKKALFVAGCQIEVTITRDGVTHRADAITPDGIVVELQHSPLSTTDIRKREDFYGDMVWLYDISSEGLYDRPGVGGWRWVNPRVSLLAHIKPVYWHVGDTVFNIDYVEGAGSTHWTVYGEKVAQPAHTWTDDLTFQDAPRFEKDEALLRRFNAEGDPKCMYCRQPMCCGQERTNSEPAHYVCTEQRKAVAA